MRTLEDAKIEYKSPISSLLWSLALPGFGQFYNGQIILGIILLILEVGTNIISNLNIAIVESFHGDFMKAHHIIKYEWGIFYPSIWSYSMWQAYNKALTINCILEGKINKNTQLTGFFFAAVVGMNIGIYCHFCLPANLHRYLQFLNSPIFSGLILGLFCGLIGWMIEEKLTERRFRKAA